MDTSHFTFKLGDQVRKTRGSEWFGTVVGFYTTEQTPEGYCIESGAHKNTVQLYPLAALERVEYIDPLVPGKRIE